MPLWCATSYMHKLMTAVNLEALLLVLCLSFKSKKESGSCWRARSRRWALRGRPAKDRYLGDPADCGTCPLRAACLKPGQDRRVIVAQRSRPTGAMRHKLRHPDARRRYARRKAIVEPVFGQLKEDRGFTALSLRGLALARAEYLLACLAHNLGKLLRVCPLPTGRLAPTTR